MIKSSLIASAIVAAAFAFAVQTADPVSAAMPVPVASAMQAHAGVTQARMMKRSTMRKRGTRTISRKLGAKRT